MAKGIRLPTCLRIVHSDASIQNWNWSYRASLQHNRSFGRQVRRYV